MTQTEKIAHLRQFYPKLADDLTIEGSLNLTGRTSLASLPDGLTVGGDVYLKGLSWYIPSDARIGGKIYQ